MGKKAKARREATTKPAAAGPPLRTAPNWPLFGLAVLGMILSGYLSWKGLGHESVGFCAAGSGCDIVLSSQWSTLLGFPTALWGFIAYASLAAIAFVKRVDRHWQYAWLVSFFGFLFSAYLTTVSITILHAACPYCLTSLVLMTATFAYVTVQRPDLQGFSWGGWLTRSAPVAAAILLLLHLNFTGVLGPAAEPDNPIARSLADHLTQKGVRFYGAQWCPHCQDQKAMFGSAAKRLPYIECSPNGVGTPQAGVCNDASVNSYPTWIIDGKRYEQVMTLTDLMNASGFKAPPPAQ
jgi:uncharacterized membrane protein